MYGVQTDIESTTLKETLEEEATNATIVMSSTTIANNQPNEGSQNVSFCSVFK